MDCVSDFDDLLMKSSDLGFEDVDNVFLFLVDNSWLWMVWSWSSRSFDNDLVDSVSNLSDLLLQDMNLVNQSVNSLNDNRWFFWFWFWVDVTFSHNLSWSSSDDSDLVSDVSDYLSDVDNLLSNVNNLLLKNNDLLFQRFLLFWLNCWNLSDDSNNVVSDLSDLSNQLSDDVSLMDNSFSELSQFDHSLMRMKTAKVWSDKSSDFSVDSGQWFGTFFGHSNFKGVASFVASLSLSGEFRGWSSAVSLLESDTFETLSGSGLLNFVTNFFNSSLFFHQIFKSGSLLFGVSTGVDWFHEAWSMNEDVKLVNIFVDSDLMDLHLMNNLLQSSSKNDDLFLDHGSLCDIDLVDFNSEDSNLLSDDVNLVNQFSDDSLVVDDNLSDFLNLSDIFLFNNNNLLSFSDDN